jgi:hypothetical protein
MGEQCVNGQCMMGMCGPGTCTGCCGGNFCVTPSMQGALACGINGVTCSQCMNGQQCVNGACVTPMCDMMSCAMGCCQNGQCRAGNMRRACGVMGNTCADCGNNGACTGGMCTSADGGTLPPPLPIGSACMASAGGGNCGAGETCLPDMGGFPGGYCSAQCAPGSPMCPMGSVCVTQQTIAGAQSYCFATCGMGCRAGYVCQQQATGASSYCRPSCANGLLASCMTGQTCDADAGTCQ